MSYYVDNLSLGKDSMAMVLRKVEEGIMPIDECVYFSMGEVEFECMFVLEEKMRTYLESHGIKFTVLHLEQPYTYLAAEKEFVKRDGRIQQGYQWCGGKCRWATSLKLQGIEKYLRSLGRDDIVQSVGIAYDERGRADKGLINNRSRFPKVYPLIEWNWTEQDCLNYCHKLGWKWEVFSETLGRNIDLYDGFLTRLSCFCCYNKSLRELYNVFRFLPD